ncbi:MAG: hypothetical protein WC326_03185 [Candidatus Delongbacteria bacterium]
MDLVPPPTHPLWVQVFSGRRKPDLQLLATKILVSRLSMTYQQDPTPGTLEQCVQDLREFFEKNQALPKAQADLRAMFTEGVQA